MRVRLENIYKSFGSVEVVKGLDLEVQDREFLVLLGASGSGKTTALRMIAGLEKVSFGSIRIGDREVTNVPPKYRDIAMVFQSYALYPHMTVFANIAYPPTCVASRKPRSRQRSRMSRGMCSLTCCSIAIPGSYRAASVSAWRSRGQ
jgi:ABC-type sugar transport system ATPase subunit